MRLLNLCKSWFGLYFLTSIIDAIMVMTYHPQFAKCSMLTILAATYIAMAKVSKSWSLIDIVLGFFTLYLAVVGFVLNDEQDLWYIGCTTQLWFVVYFFVGEYEKCNDSTIFNKGIYFFLFACFIGIPLFFNPPSWYIDFKFYYLGEMKTEGIILENFRFSSLWPGGYWISYGVTIFFIYVLHRCFVKNNISLVDISILVFMALIALLAQMRAALGYMAFVALFYLLYSTFLRRYKRNGNFKRVMVFLVVLFALLISALLLYLDSSIVDNFLRKIDGSKSDSFISERANMFSGFLNNISFWGAGIGSASHSAANIGKESITDQMYIRILYETGIFGFTIYIFIFLAIFFKGIRNFRYYIFELLVFGFYIGNMTGADSLAVIVQHPLIFWFCCGRIFNKKLLQKRKTDYETFFI